MPKLLLLSASEFGLRVDKVRAAFVPEYEDYGIIIADNANLFYLTGRVFDGYVLLPAGGGEPHFFVRRPNNLEGDNLTYIRKPEEMLPSVAEMCRSGLGLELDSLPYTQAQRLMALAAGRGVANVSPAMMAARSVKTDEELRKLREDAVKQAAVYSRVPSLFREGMSDVELQIEIERQSRLEGCLGQFRIAGGSMELYMGNVLVGENADRPSPYDFAMGGAGQDSSLPVGADGTIIRPGTTVMVDMNGNYNGYMTDMTRVFALGTLPQPALRAHLVSISICAELAAAGKPGVEAKVLYEMALKMARDEGFEPNFMGHLQHAGFVGHGVGIEVNEWPVIAPRSRHVLRKGQVIALEPKFVFPGVGAVGIENTYVVTDTGMQPITRAPEEIIYFN